MLIYKTFPGHSVRELNSGYDHNSNPRKDTPFLPLVPSLVVGAGTLQEPQAH